MEAKEIIRLKNTCTEMRKLTAKMIHRAKNGHLGGSFSAMEFTAACYFKEMNYRADDPKWEDRDRFLLSKGHAAEVQYTALALKGVIPMEALDTYGDTDTILQAHPDMYKCPGIEMSTGSLGQGLSCAVGMAIAGKNDGKDYFTYCVVGDGESNEGAIWEALEAASKYQLDHLIIFLDRNHLQSDGTTEEIMNPLDLKKKFEDFGCDVIEIDGNDIEEVVSAIEQAKSNLNGKPTCIYGNTIKGKGVSFTENVGSWHGGVPTDEQLAQMLEELDAQIIKEED